jgi:NAD(P)-dependent dehydrogenase (short-subunit alcohol dehydrogenase family)
VIRLDGKVVVLTGAAGMIGADTARVLAEAGARVVLTDIAEDRLTTVTKTLADEGLDVAGQVSDITDEGSARDLIAFALDRYGRIDVLDNNAGATGLTREDGDVLALTTDLWRRSSAINLVGPLQLCRQVIPLMTEQGGGVIVNISSGQSLSGDIMNSAYAAGKAALNSLTRDIATQYGPAGIRCNAVAPGLIVAEENEGALPPPIRDLFVENCSVPRLGRPRDIANAVLFLASDLAAYITGQVLSVDGGILEHLPTVAGFRALAPGSFSTKGQQ